MQGITLSNTFESVIIHVGAVVFQSLIFYDNNFHFKCTI